MLSRVLQLTVNDKLFEADFGDARLQLHVLDGLALAKLQETIRGSYGKLIFVCDLSDFSFFRHGLLGHAIWARCGGLGRQAL